MIFTRLMNKLILTAAVVLSLLFSACLIQPYQHQNLPRDTPEEETIQQHDLFTEKGQSKNESTTPAIKPSVKDDFYYVDKPHWAHMPITYYLNEKQCGPYEATRIKRALGSIINATNNAVTFKKVNSSVAADINVSCTFVENCYETSVDIYSDYVIRYETICKHELGLTKAIIEGNIITEADIGLFGLAGFAETKHEGPSGFYVGTCGHTITETHELLHAFGYHHSQDNNSIMYPDADVFGLITQQSGACKGSEKQIDKDIVEDMIKTYSG